MEAADGHRQSGLLSLINRDQNETFKKDAERTFPTMATSVVSAPLTYPPPPYSHSSNPPSKHSLPALIAPTESVRRDEKNSLPSPAHRQSLPCIHEALGGSKPAYNSQPPAASPRANSAPYGQAQRGAPQPPPSSIPRSYPVEAPPYPSHNVRRSPPQQMHPPPPTNAAAAYAEAARNPLPSTPVRGGNGPPPGHFSGHPYEMPKHDRDPRSTEGVTTTSGYTHLPPHQPQYNAYHPSPQVNASRMQPPPLQIQPDYHQQNSYHPRQRPEGGDRYIENGEPSNPRQPWPVVKRHLDVFDLELCLADINSSCNTLLDFSAHYHRIAQESQRSAPAPERMPSINECDSMIAQQQRIAGALQHIRDKMLEQIHIKADQHAREQGGKGVVDEYGDDGSIFGDDGKSQGFGSQDAKKRRGRAAPPGRCHSCNRAETPEWRRGPDGARTLCNACGLHYAKLTRKVSKQSQSNPPPTNPTTLRPKSLDDGPQRS